MREKTTARLPTPEPLVTNEPDVLHAALFWKLAMMLVSVRTLTAGYELRTNYPCERLLQSFAALTIVGEYEG